MDGEDKRDDRNFPEGILDKGDDSEILGHCRGNDEGSCRGFAADAPGHDWRAPCFEGGCCTGTILAF